VDLVGLGVVALEATSNPVELPRKHFDVEPADFVAAEESADAAVLILATAAGVLIAEAGLICQTLLGLQMSQTDACMTLKPQHWVVS
jgi:hypothetical protein